MPAFEAGRALRPGERAVLAGSTAAHHITDVLRSRNGEKIMLFHDGEIYDAVVEDCSRENFTVTVTTVRSAPLAEYPLILVQAVIRPALLDDIVRVCSPLGVSRFIFYTAERSQPWNMMGRLKRLGQVALAATEQAETGRVPDIETADSLSDALSRLGKVQTVLALSPRSSLTMAALVQRGSLALEGVIAAVVGPEGGFTAHEEELLRAGGAVSIRLSTGILRSELAGFAAGLIVRELQSLQ